MQNVDSLLITNSYFSYGVQTNYLLITHPPPHQPKDQDTSLMIEGMASEGWIRGGVPSRELTRDRDFYTTHTAGQSAP